MIGSPYSYYVVSNDAIAVSSRDEQGSSINTVNSNFSKLAGFKKIGVHHVVLPPGARTSLPHAESLEEEFVFVISGHPHGWIDGYVYQLKPGCAAGFPAGTGVAHNFINNTQQNVELLVLGERTKKENLCSFPVNPKQKEKSDIWWADSPQRPLGPHNGKPGPIQPHEVGPIWPNGIIDCTTHKTSKGWHYPGDNETFSEYARLTDPLGLKVFGIGFESLAPGKRSSLPHSHKTEEEFVFVLSGTATVWMNGFVHEAKPGDGVLFVPGTNIAHTIINNTEEPLRYIVVGEASDEAHEDRIYYPAHTFRNEQCKIRGDFWEDRPQNVPMGRHNGRPQEQIPEHLCLRHGSSKDEHLVLEIFKKSSAYFRRVDGVEPTLKTVRHEMQGRPDKRTEAYRKEFLIVEYSDQPVGVADIHIHHPESGIVYIGLLLVTEDLFGKGLGRRSYNLIEHYVKTIFEVRVMRLGVSKSNDVSEFWQRMGFSPNGKTYDWKGEVKTTHVIEFEKQLVKACSIVSILPKITDRNHYKALFSESGHWDHAIAHLIKKHNLTGEIRRGVLGSHIVYRIGYRWIKLMAPLFAADMAFELSGLRAVDGKLSVRTPQIIAEGNLEGWPYVILSHIEGEPIRNVWPTLGESQKILLAQQIATITKELSACTPDSVIKHRFIWNDFIQRQYEDCEVQQKKKDLPESWLIHVKSFLATFDQREFQTDKPVFLHADLTFDHFLVTHEGQPRISGIIDMADCQVGHFEYELVAPSVFIFKGNKTLLRHYLLQCGFPESQLNHRFSEKLLAWSILHRYFSLISYFKIEMENCRLGDFSALAEMVFPLT